VLPANQDILDKILAKKENTLRFRIDHLIVKGKIVIRKSQKSAVKRKQGILQIHDLAINQNLQEAAVNLRNPVQVTPEINLHRRVRVILDRQANHLQDQVTVVHQIDHHHLVPPTADPLRVLHPEVHLPKVVLEVVVRHEVVVNEDS